MAVLLDANANGHFPFVFRHQEISRLNQSERIGVECKYIDCAARWYELEFFATTFKCVLHGTLHDEMLVWWRGTYAAVWRKPFPLLKFAAERKLLSVPEMPWLSNCPHKELFVNCTSVISGKGRTWFFSYYLRKCKSNKYRAFGLFCFWSVWSVQRTKRYHWFPKHVQLNRRGTHRETALIPRVGSRQWRANSDSTLGGRTWALWL